MCIVWNLETGHILVSVDLLLTTVFTLLDVFEVQDKLVDKRDINKIFQRQEAKEGHNNLVGEARPVVDDQG